MVDHDRRHLTTTQLLEKAAEVQAHVQHVVSEAKARLEVAKKVEQQCHLRLVQSRARHSLSMDRTLGHSAGPPSVVPRDHPRKSIYEVLYKAAEARAGAQDTVLYVEAVHRRVQETRERLQRQKRRLDKPNRHPEP